MISVTINIPCDQKRHHSDEGLQLVNIKYLERIRLSYHIDNAELSLQYALLCVIYI